MRAIRMLVFVCGLLSGSFAQERMAPTAARVNSAVEQLDSFIRASMTSTKVPGVAVAVVYNDKVVFLRGYGDAMSVNLRQSIRIRSSKSPRSRSPLRRRSWRHW